MGTAPDATAVWTRNLRPGLRLGDLAEGTRGEVAGSAWAKALRPSGHWAGRHNRFFLQPRRPRAWAVSRLNYERRRPVAEIRGSIGAVGFPTNNHRLGDPPRHFFFEPGPTGPACRRANLNKRRPLAVKPQ